MFKPNNETYVFSSEFLAVCRLGPIPSRVPSVAIVPYFTRPSQSRTDRRRALKLNLRNKGTLTYY